MAGKILFIGSGSEAYCLSNLGLGGNSYQDGLPSHEHIVFLDAVQKTGRANQGYRSDLISGRGSFGGSAYTEAVFSGDDIEGVVRAIGDNEVWADWRDWCDDLRLSVKLLTVIPHTVRLWMHEDDNWASDRYPGVVFHHNVYVGQNCRVGEGTILNTGCIIEHDCTIEPDAFVAPGAILCGGVTIRKSAFIGAGAMVAPGVTVGARQFVKMGTVVGRDLPDLAVFGRHPLKS